MILPHTLRNGPELVIKDQGLALSWGSRKLLYSPFRPHQLHSPRVAGIEWGQGFPSHAQACKIIYTKCLTRYLAQKGLSLVLVAFHWKAK